MQDLLSTSKISAPNVTPSRWWCVDSQNKGKELVNGTGGFDVTTFGPSSGSCPQLIRFLQKV